MEEEVTELFKLITELRKDLSQLESPKDKEVGNVRHWQTLERKYSIIVKTLGVAIEESKQRIVAIAAKVRRHQERVHRFRQNRMYLNNRGQFYRELNQEGERCNVISHMLKNQKSFGETFFNITKQEKVDITKESLKKVLGRMPNWKSPNPDLVQGFRLKNFSGLHGRVRSKFKEYLDSGFVPSWLIEGRTALLQKDKSKGNIASNYRPITCLPLM